MNEESNKPMDEAEGADIGEAAAAARAKYIGDILANREQILAAFVAQHGFLPDRMVQVTKPKADGSIEWYVMLNPDAPLLDESDVEAPAERAARLKADAEEACVAAFEDRRRIEAAVNWADLHCTQAVVGVDDTGAELLAVVIEEADPGADELHEYVRAHLTAKGWPQSIDINTEW